MSSFLPVKKKVVVLAVLLAAILTYLVARGHVYFLLLPVGAPTSEQTDCYAANTIAHLTEKYVGNEYSFNYPSFLSIKSATPVSQDQNTTQVAVFESIFQLPSFEKTIITVSLTKDVMRLHFDEYAGTHPELVPCNLVGKATVHVSFTDSAAPFGGPLLSLRSYIKLPDYEENGSVLWIQCFNDRRGKCEILVPQILSTLKF